METLAITFEHYLARSMNYEAYHDLIETLHQAGKTTGPNQSEELLEYSKLNMHRMKKWEKIGQLEDETKKVLQAVSSPMIWLIITEGWCGDAAQSIPFIEKMAAENPLIETRYVLRDENLELMDAYLTNGARSIPKLIVIDAQSGKEISSWGPRPSTCISYIQQLKAENPSIAKEEFITAVHAWYARDKGKSIQSDFRHLLT
ncbi:thioredoxin family protein [Cytophagales bacterium LB-30]|uniref:Thioredoxin family protein n=1 Tax=Shiella aurantiaca TaxID=3058365 RepID=A0ABT8F897_9BACT|nr:thioredoxin family protein [Shiella aurantiaca]MDN4166436.1 thioredoxin family protein [Shiella aurantiaca]